MADDLLALLGRLLEQGGCMLCMWHVFGQLCMWTQECQHLSSRVAGMAYTTAASWQGQQPGDTLQFVCNSLCAKAALSSQQLDLQHSTNQADHWVTGIISSFEPAAAQMICT